MKTREDLHAVLCDILGSNHCYFSPPSNIHMTYPCIKYEADGSRTLHADDRRYFHRNRYSLIVIDECEDSDISKRLFNDGRLVYLEEGTTYVADGLYHYPFVLYL